MSSTTKPTSFTLDRQIRAMLDENGVTLHPRYFCTVGDERQCSFEIGKEIYTLVAGKQPRFYRTKSGLNWPHSPKATRQEVEEYDFWENVLKVQQETKGTDDK